MENFGANTAGVDVDVLPTKELSLMMLILRRVTVESLKTASAVLDMLASSLDEEKTDTDTGEEPAELTRIVSEEISVRQRKDTLESTDSGFGDECSFSSEMDQETGLEVISLEEVSNHCTKDDGWMVLYDKVYDVTEYLERMLHPGGEDVIAEYLGYDATMAFRGVGHSRGVLRILEKYVV